MTTDNGKSQMLEITFGKQRIPFALDFRERTRLAISVHPDRSVSVVAPCGRTVAEVLDRVQKRAAWIVKQRSHFDQFHPLTPPRRYVAGETHLYLGRQYRLKLISDDKPAVKLVGAFLRVHLSSRNDTDKIRHMLDAWYQNHARHIFSRRLEVCLESARALGPLEPDIVIRKMSKRWGSCTNAKCILLNTELVKTPLYCIEYVILHELCHLKVHNHSPAFYQLLDRCMPDWERRKKRLDLFVL